MGVDDTSGPPKKKLKQAQLSFASVTPRSKRKLSADHLDENAQAVKIACKTRVSRFAEKVKSDVSVANVLRTSDSNGNTDKESGIDISADCSTDKESGITALSDKSSEEKGDESIVLDKSDDVVNLNLTADLTESSLFVLPKEVGLDSKSDTDGQIKKTEEAELSENNKISLNISGNCDEKVVPSPKTPKTPKTDKIKSLTPKQLEKKRILEEKRKKKLEEEEEKKRKKLEEEEEKRRKKEEREKKKLEEEEEKKKKKLEKEKKKEELRLKEEEKDEKKRKTEEARLLEEKKEAQAKQAFSNFFKKSKKSREPQVESVSQFMPFPVKPDMRLAGERRPPLSPNSKKNLDSFLKRDSCDDQLYLKSLKNGHVPLKCEATWPVSDEQHDVIIIESVEDENVMEVEEEKSKTKRGNRAKLFQFHENRRPPYWGTWRKKSIKVKPRKPFDKDQIFDYEVDSDSEWEDEGEGEDIGKEDDSDKEQSDDEEVGENGYIIDKTFVPHGYLSDEEAADDENFDPEDQKLRMKVLKEEFDEEMKSKTQRLKPRLLGCVWITNETLEVSQGSLYELIYKCRGVWDEDRGPIDLLSPPEMSPMAPVKFNPNFPQEVFDSLVKFVHGCTLPLSKILNDFLELVRNRNPTVNVSKNAITQNVRKIASKGYNFEGKACWEVNEDLRIQYGLQRVDFNPDAPPAPVVEIKKPKENPILSLFKQRNESPPSIKKRVSLITLDKPKNEKNSLESSKSASPLVKKRIPFTTLTTPVSGRLPEVTITPVSGQKSKVNLIHVDTPRPFHPMFKAVQEKSRADEQKAKEKTFKPETVVDLTEDSK